MELIYYTLSVILVIVSVLLVIVILMQKTKGAEIGAVFGSGAAAAVLGAGAANFLTKLTYWLGGIFLALVFTLSYIHHKMVTTNTVIQTIPEEIPSEKVEKKTEQPEKVNITPVKPSKKPTESK